MYFPTDVCSVPAQCDRFSHPHLLLQPPWHLGVPTASRSGRGLLWGSPAVTALGAGSSCSAHLHRLPARPPLLLLVSSASHFPSKLLALSGRRELPGRDAYSIDLGEKQKGSALWIWEWGKWPYPKSSFSQETVVSGLCPISVVSLVYPPTSPEFCPDGVLSLTLPRQQLANLYIQAKRRVNYSTCDQVMCNCVTSDYWINQLTFKSISVADLGGFGPGVSHKPSPWQRGRERGPAEPGTALAAPRGRSGAAVRGATQQHECFRRPCQLRMRERMVILLSLKELTALLGEQWTSYCRALPGCGGRRRPSSGRRSARGISSIGRCLLNQLLDARVLNFSFFGFV